jgi:hypothetical protein
MMRDRSAFLDGLKARLESERAGRGGPEDDGAPQPPGAPAATDGRARVQGGGSHAPAPSRPVPELDSRSAADPEGDAASATPDLGKAPRPWSESGMPERMRQAIASVRRISTGEPAALADPERAPRGLREEPRRFAPADPPGWSAPSEPPEPSLPETPEPFPAEPFPPEVAPRPPAASGGFAPPLFPEPSEPPSGGPEPPPLDAAEPPPPGFPEAPAALDRPARRPYPRPSEDEPGPGRGIRIAALAMAAAVVLLVGSGVGALLAGWRFELPSVLSGTAATPEPAAQSEAQRAVANAPDAPPPIAEVRRVEPAPLPPSATVEPTPEPARSEGAAGVPLPPPPKPAPWSRVATESAAANDDAVDDALDALLRETDGAGGPLELSDGEEALPAATRVAVHYAAHAPGEQAEAMHLARLLEAKGIAVEAREVDSPIDLDGIRYFFPADRDDAEALSASLEGQVPGGAAPPVLDFTAHEPKPSPGYLELWIGP